MLSYRDVMNRLTRPGQHNGNGSGPAVGANLNSDYPLVPPPPDPLAGQIPDMVLQSPEPPPHWQYGHKPAKPPRPRRPRLIYPTGRTRTGYWVIVAAWPVTMVVCWWLMVHNLSWTSFFLLGFVVPLGGPPAALRWYCGSEKAAQQYATEDFQHRRQLRYHCSELPRFVHKRILPGEKVRGWYREHPVSMLRPHSLIAVGLAFVAAALFIGLLMHKSHPALALAGAAAFTMLVLRPWLWWRSVLVLTDDRLMQVSGIVVTNVAMMPRAKLTDAGLRTPWISTLLSRLRLIYLPYGTIHFESAGQDQALKDVAFLPAVNEVFLLVQLVVDGRAGKRKLSGQDPEDD